MNIRYAGAVIGILVATPGVAAAAGPGLYGVISGYGTYLEDSDSLAADTVGNSADFTTSYDFGWGVSGAAGFGWNTGQPVCSTLGLEGEVSYRNNDLDEIDVNSITLAGIGSFGPVGTASAGGDVSALGVMANVRCEVPLAPGKLYFLGGGGGANVSLDNLSIAGTPVGLNDDDDWVGAFQFGAGWMQPLNQNADLVVGYRYFATGDPEFVEGTGVPFDTEYSSHNIEVGIEFF